MNDIILEGYHITDTKLCENIIREGFKSKQSPKHYLGQGIYFYSDYTVAKLNILNKNINFGSGKDKSIIHCIISAPKKSLLDLDDPLQNTKLRNYWNNVLRKIENHRISVTFQTKDDFLKNKKLYYKCFVLDLYKREYNYNIVSKTFAIDAPSYGKAIYGLDFSGIPYLEKYICVSENDFIQTKDVIYSVKLEEDLFI